MMVQDLLQRYNSVKLRYCGIG